jgi:hypothetical protein
MLTTNFNPADLLAVKSQLQEKKWLIACLCAAWCDTCETYRAPFETLMRDHSDKCFTWIDIEDHAALVDELEIENFPTILIEYQDQVLFFGTMLPDVGQLKRLILSLENTQASNATSSVSQQPKIFEGMPSTWSLRKQLLQQNLQQNPSA